MNRMVFEHYPASKLPDDMRAQVDPSSIVTVVVTVESQPSEKVLTLAEICRMDTP